MEGKGNGGEGKRRDRRGGDPSRPPLILRKIIKIVAIRCQILRLKCTNFAPDPAGGAYSTPPDPLAGFKGPNSKGREGMRMGGGGREMGRGREMGKG